MTVALQPAAASFGLPVMSRMAAEVRAGLLAPEPWLPSTYFYDDRGSELFEEITRLPEYYQTRTERAILTAAADAIVARAAPREIVELGSGANRKLGLLLDAAARAGNAPAVVLFDINARDVEVGAARLRATRPGVRVRGVVGDFLASLDGLGPLPGRMFVLFGGTIGNLHPTQVGGFLRRLARRLPAGGTLLVGLDLVKDPARLEAAYNDAAGVTARFNLNLLRHINGALNADFDLRRWRHRAFYDPRHDWIEMRLVSRAHQRVRIEGAWLDLRYRPGDELRTEYSCKYTEATFRARLQGTGLRLEAWHTDPEKLFALALCRQEAR